MENICRICRSKFDGIEIQLPCCNIHLCQKHMCMQKDAVYRCDICKQYTNLKTIFNSPENQESIKKFRLQKLKEKIKQKLVEVEANDKESTRSQMQANYAETKQKLDLRRAELKTKLLTQIDAHYDDLIKSITDKYKENYSILLQYKLNKAEIQSKLDTKEFEVKNVNESYSKLTQILNELSQLTSLRDKFELINKNDHLKIENHFGQLIPASQIETFQSKLKNYFKIHNFSTELLIYKKNLLYSFSCMEISNDGLIFLGDEKADIDVIDLNKREKVRCLNEHFGKITVIVYHEPSKKLITGSDDTNVKIWNLSTWKCEFTLKGRYDSVQFIKCFKNGDILACYLNNPVMKIWCPISGRLKRDIDAKCFVKSVEISESDIIIGSSHDSIKIFDSLSGECKRRLIGHFKTITCLKTLPGNRLVSGSSDSILKIWDLNTGICVRTIYGHNKTVKWVELLDSETLVSLSEDEAIKFWDLKSGKCLAGIDKQNGEDCSIGMKTWNEQLFCLDRKQILKWCLECYNY